MKKRAAKKRRRNTGRTNLKRTKLLKAIGQGMNISEAGRAAGYGTSQSAHRALKRMEFYLPEILDRIDIPAEKVLQKFKDQLDARETKFFVVKNKIVTRTVMAQDLQHRAAVELGKIHRLYPSRVELTGNEGVPLIPPSLIVEFHDPEMDYDPDNPDGSVKTADDGKPAEKPDPEDKNPSDI
jgi:hypothetical protein